MPDLKKVLNNLDRAFVHGRDSIAIFVGLISINRPAPAMLA
jgi:hypothetical protein